MYKIRFKNLKLQIIVGLFLIISNFSFSQQFTEQIDIKIPGVYQGSVNWGDYNNDGLLDFMMTGEHLSNGNEYYYSAIYNNLGNNVFESDTNKIKKVTESSLEWGDYNNDNFLDILLSGYYIINNYVFLNSDIYKNNKNETFTYMLSPTLTPIGMGNMTWGDYSQDGYADILQTGFGGGTFISKIYNNNKKNFFDYQNNINIEKVTSSDVVWGDYNNDGNLDFIIAGMNGTTRITKIYKNNGNNTFTEQTDIQITGVDNVSIDFGDYNNDGYLDILLTGYHWNDTSYEITKIYKNNGDGTFTEVNNLKLIGVHLGCVCFGDYDNDGMLDILLTGSDKNVIPQTKIYKNNGDDTFTEQIDINLKTVSNSSIDFGDYDNDEDLDILLNGLDENGITVSKIYKNNCTTPNIRPNIINNLQTKAIGTDVVFSWDAATDNNQPSAGLNYNIYVYETPTLQNALSGQTGNVETYVASPQAFPQTDALNGKRLLAEPGSIQGVRENGRVSYTLKGVFEQCKSYTWSVQAIDASFAGGEFAPEVSFVYDTIAPVPAIQNLLPIKGICSANINTIPTATDDCNGIIYATTTDALQYSTQGNYIITWTYDDGNGNITTQNQTVVVDDYILPTVSCITDKTINLLETQQFYTVAGTELDVLSATDNCGVSNITNSYNNLSTLANAALPIGTTTIVWTATDNAQNTDYCSFDVTVNQVLNAKSLTNDCSFWAYPNPAKDETTVFTNQTLNATIEIYNNIGEKVYSEEVNNQLSKISLNGFAKGIYLIKLITKDNTKIIKLVKS